MTTAAIDKNDCYERARAVRKFAGEISNTTLWRWIRAGAFPAPVRLGPSPVRFWRRSDLEKWAADRAGRSTP